MENKEEFKEFLKNEAESLTKKVKDIEVKMTNILTKQGLSALGKINKLNHEKELLNSQIFKLYELIGKL